MNEPGVARISIELCMRLEESLLVEFGPGDSRNPAQILVLRGIDFPLEVRRRLQRALLVENKQPNNPGSVALGRAMMVG